MKDKINSNKTLSDAEIVQVRLKKKGFPFGIFLLLFVALSLIAAGATASYFFFVGRMRIQDIESYTRGYSITLAEAFAHTAELSFNGRTYGPLRALFSEKIQKNTFDEAFFVLKDGKLAAHSSPDIEKELKGNIANDEFAYNRDMILKPIQTKSREIYFTNYNIISKRVPFHRNERNFLKKYFYDSIDSSGWLVTRAVFVKNNPVGTVNFIVAKDRIFDCVLSLWNESIRILVISLCGVFFISLFVAVVVFARYRSIQRKTMEFAQRNIQAGLLRRETHEEEIPDWGIAEGTQGGQFDEDEIVIDLGDDTKEAGAAPMPELELDELELSGEGIATGEMELIEVEEAKEEEKPEVIRVDRLFDARREIKDAIPIQRRSS